MLLLDGINLFSLPYGIRNNLLPRLDNYPWVRYYKKDLKYVTTYNNESDSLFVPCAKDKHEALDILNTDVEYYRIEDINESTFNLMVRENEINYHFYSRSFRNANVFYNQDQLRFGLAVLKCSYFEFYDGTNKSEKIPIGRWKGQITHNTPDNVVKLFGNTIDRRFDLWGLSNYSLLSSEIVEDDKSISRVDIWKISVFSDSGAGSRISEEEYRYRINKNDGKVFFTIQPLKSGR